MPAEDSCRQTTRARAGGCLGPGHWHIASIAAVGRRRGPGRPVAAESRQLERLRPVATGRRQCGTAEDSRRRATRATARHRCCCCVGPLLRAGNSFPAILCWPASGRQFFSKSNEGKNLGERKALWKSKPARERGFEFIIVFKKPTQSAALKIHAVSTHRHAIESVSFLDGRWQVYQ
jgi:hypothetical protein